MKRSGPVALAILVLLPVAGRMADATAPVDYTNRNEAFAPAATVQPAAKAPTVNSTLQNRAVDKTMVDKSMSAICDRRAAIDVGETRDKTVHTPDSRRREVVTEPMSPLNHRMGPFDTGADTTKPALVSKYQDSLTAASASNMARFPALDHATAAKINRFVFRKNPPGASAPAVAPVIRAGGDAAPTATSSRPPDPR
jgi:hypothetical protein